MKKIVLIMSLFLVSSNFIFAQNNKMYNHSIQINPIYYIFNLVDVDKYAIEYQLALSDYFSLSLEPIIIKQISITDILNTYSLQLGVLYRPFASRLKGFSIGTYSGIGYGKFEIQNDYCMSYLIQGEIGYQWIIWNGLTLALGVGCSKWFVIEPEIYSGPLYFQELPITLEIRTSIGISF